MDQGRIVADGTSDRVAAMYLQSGLGTSADRVWDNRYGAPGDEVARLRRVRCYTEDGEVQESFDIRRPIGIDIEFDVLSVGYVLVPSIDVWNDDGVCVLSALDLDPEWRRRPRTPGRYRTTVWIPGNYLSEQRLSVRVAVSTHAPFKVHCDAPDAVAFMVTDALDGDSARGDYGGGMPGVTRPYLSWSNSIIEPADDELAPVAGI
jgi:lipopolysaccharide transport system ATP-binding protein